MLDLRYMPQMTIVLTKELQKEIPEKYHIKDGNRVILDRDRYTNEVVSPPPDPQTWAEFVEIFGDGQDD